MTERISLHFLLYVVSLAKSLSTLFVSSKTQLFVSLIFSGFFHLFYFLSNYYFLPSADFGLHFWALLLFLTFLGDRSGCLAIFLFFEIAQCYHELPS